MQLREFIVYAIVKRSLASLIVLSMSLMSSAVGSCEVSCLLEDGHCANEMVQGSAASGTADRLQLAVRTSGRADSAAGLVEAASACNDELCKDGSVSAVFPAARVEIPKTQAAAGVVVFAPSATARAWPSHESESPPPKAVSLNSLSVNLRI